MPNHLHAIPLLRHQLHAKHHIRRLSFVRQAQLQLKRRLPFSLIEKKISSYHKKIFFVAIKGENGTNMEQTFCAILRDFARFCVISPPFSSPKTNKNKEENSTFSMLNH
jgi:hypothetical protein